MSELTKNFLLRAKINDEIYNVFPQTTSHNVIVDKTTGETLKQRLVKIAQKINSENSDINAKIDEVKQEISKIISDTPGALNDLKDIADWINGHETEVAALKTTAEGVHQAIEDKIGDIGDYDTVAAYIAAVQDNVDTEATRAKAAEEALDARLDTIEGTGTGSIAKALSDAKTYADDLVDAEAERAKSAEQTNAGNLAAEIVRAKAVEAELAKDLVFFDSLDDYDPKNFNELAGIMMPDDPVEVATEAEIVTALAGTNPEIMLFSDIVISTEIANAIEVTTDKTIDLNGYTLKVEG